MRANHIIPVFNHSRTFKVIIDRDYWRNADSVVPEDSLVWFTEDPGCPQGWGLKFFMLDQIGAWASLWVNLPVFQTEIYAILQCAYENIRRAYRNKWILIFSDSLKKGRLAVWGGLP
jgi:hypothetical protein